MLQDEHIPGVLKVKNFHLKQTNVHYHPGSLILSIPETSGKKFQRVRRDKEELPVTQNNNGASVEPSGGRNLWWTFSSCLTLGQNASNLWKLGLPERDFHCFLTVTGG